jgi:hypothetical protein
LKGYSAGKDSHSHLGNLVVVLEKYNINNTSLNTMSTENPKSENELEEKAAKLIAKGKVLANQATDFLVDKAKEIEKSEAVGSISRLFHKVGSYLDKKSEELHNGEMNRKLEILKEQAEEKTTSFLNKAKETSRKFGDAVDDQLEDLKGKKNKPTNQDGSGI